MTKPTSIDQPAQDSKVSPEATETDKKFEASWKACTYLTPRQASAIALTLVLWADGDINEWSKDPSEKPLHEVRPFEYFDSRVMFHVGESHAWAVRVAERCYAVALEIEAGLLPFDRVGGFIDELLVMAALEEAEAHLAEAPEVFERIPSRLGYEYDDGDGVFGDDEWSHLGDQFGEMSRWPDPEAVFYRNDPILPFLLAKRHPFAWFDLGPASGIAGHPGYLISDDDYCV